MEEYLTARDIMRILKVSRAQAYNYIREKRIRSFKVGRLVRIKADDLKQFVEGKHGKEKD